MQHKPKVVNNLPSLAHRWNIRAFKDPDRSEEISDGSK